MPALLIPPGREICRKSRSSPPAIVTCGASTSPRTSIVVPLSGSGSFAAASPRINTALPAFTSESASKKRLSPAAIVTLPAVAVAVTRPSGLIGRPVSVCESATVPLPDRDSR